MKITLRNRLILLAVMSLCFSCKEKEKENINVNKSVRVETLTIAGTDLNSSRTYSGTIEEGEGTPVSFSAAGTIKQFLVEPGQHVAQGQVIGRIDDSSLKNAYDIALATLAQAQDAYNRMKQLHDSNSLPDIKWVDIEQKLKQAESAAQIARNALDDATLRAPYSGIVAEKFADVGQVVAPGVPVAKIMKINSVKAVISVPENEISAFRNGMAGDITVSSLNDKEFNGTVTEKGVNANPLSRTYAVKFAIDNRNGELLPGMICNVRLAGDVTDNVIVLPQSAVLLDEHNRNFVWIDSAGTAQRHTVTVSELNPDGIIITSGLKDGDVVIVKGMQKVCNGTPVESINK